MASTEVLWIRGLTHRYAEKVTLDGVSLTVEPGEVHAIVGPSRSGKTTLTHILGGNLTLAGGEIHLCGRPLQVRRPLDAWRAGIGVVYDSLALVPSLTVEANVGLPWGTRRGLLARQQPAEMRIKTIEALQILQSSVTPATPIAHLTAGERQLVALARAISMRPCVLVLDEPTTQLDREQRSAVHQALGRLQQDGVGILYMTHDIEEVLGLANRISILRAGRMILTCTQNEMTVGHLLQVVLLKELSSGKQESETSIALQAQRFLTAALGARESERTRIAREVHDGLQPLLFGALYEAHACARSVERHPKQALERLQLVQNVLNSAIREMRGIIQNLTPEALRELGLAGAVRRHAEWFQTAFAIETRVIVSPATLPQLPLETAMSLYRIIQEALQNVWKHAQATRVEIRLNGTGSRLDLSVTDNGCGFSVTAAGSEGEKLGLVTIRQRAESVGARLNVKSEPGQGTCVTASVPVSNPVSSVAVRT